MKAKKYTNWTRREMIGELVLRGYDGSPDWAKTSGRATLKAILVAYDVGLWGPQNDNCV
jgi:hypothetical protein